ncbi:MAG: hypothetical protein OER86_09515 [Phycisphaerae bacterium]|nr:hypothetical protein [Phycisphaerae bacterium]
MGSSRYLNVILTVLTVVLALNLWTSWTQAPPLAASAFAQGVPDSGSQRQQIVDQLKVLNRKAEELKSMLGSGKVRVQVSMPPGARK